MIKIMHTADLHLCEDREDRWDAFAALVQIGKAEGINVMVISGDLFDQNVDAEILRPRLRETLGVGYFETLILPGNHDRNSYREGLYFGDGVRVIKDLDNPVELGAVRFWGMPFELLRSEEIALKLRNWRHSLDDKKTDILLYHGELLDSFFSRQDLGDEGYERYMPLKLSYFKDIKVDYVLAGHFHSRFGVWELENGGYFVYPGSPVPVTRRETGRRKFNIFTIGEHPRAMVLDTLHYEEVIIDLDPFDSRNPLDIIGEYLDNLHPAAKMILCVRGFINGDSLGMDEQQLVREINRIAASKCIGEIVFEFRDIRMILESDLFHLFMERLEKSEFPTEKKIHVRDMTIKAMMGVSS